MQAVTPAVREVYLMDDSVWRPQHITTDARGCWLAYPDRTVFAPWTSVKYIVWVTKEEEHADDRVRS